VSSCPGSNGDRSSASCTNPGDDRLPEKSRSCAAVTPPHLRTRNRQPIARWPTMVRAKRSPLRLSSGRVFPFGRAVRPVRQVKRTRQDGRAQCCQGLCSTRLRECLSTALGDLPGERRRWSRAEDHNHLNYTRIPRCGPTRKRNGLQPCSATTCQLEYGPAGQWPHLRALSLIAPTGACCPGPSLSVSGQGRSSVTSVMYSQGKRRRALRDAPVGACKPAVGRRLELRSCVPGSGCPAYQADEGEAGAGRDCEHRFGEGQA
jgi:hypothetical protein